MVMLVVASLPSILNHISTNLTTLVSLVTATRARTSTISLSDLIKQANERTLYIQSMIAAHVDARKLGEKIEVKKREICSPMELEEQVLSSREIATVDEIKVCSQVC